MTIQDLINQVNGKKINTDGADNGQCTAIPHTWEAGNGWPVVLGNAKDTYADAPVASYDHTLNSQTNYPQPGAIIVWGATWGEGYGHTAVVVSANQNIFTCVEQNDGDNGLAHVGSHNYSGVLGWFTPKALEAPAVQAPATGTGFPKTVTVNTACNARTAPSIAAPVAAVVHVGTIVVTGEVGGGNGTVGAHTSNQWYVTQAGHYFDVAATE